MLSYLFLAVILIIIKVINAVARHNTPLNDHCKSSDSDQTWVVAVMDDCSRSRDSSSSTSRKVKNQKKRKGPAVNGAEMQRKKRVASYKVYSVEGKMKMSWKKSFRWIKNRCSQVVYGWT